MTDKPMTAVRRWIQRIAPALLLACALPSAQAADPQTFSAGLRMGAIPYRQVSMPVALTYPTRAEATARDFGPFRMTVAAGAPAAQAPETGWPVVFVSHGTGGSVFGHADLVAALARAGYVVVALEHPGDNFRDRSLVTDNRYFSERPAQLLALLDRLVDSGRTVIVIEHHQAVMAHADWIIDLGPGAGHEGGRIVFEGPPAQLVAERATLTGRHLARYVDAAKTLGRNSIFAG